jgi:hypothetical protein
VCSRARDQMAGGPVRTRLVQVCLCAVAIAPLRYRLFTPELQWQSRGQCILQGGVAVGQWQSRGKRRTVSHSQGGACGVLYSYQSASSSPADRDALGSPWWGGVPLTPELQWQPRAQRRTSQGRRASERASAPLSFSPPSPCMIHSPPCRTKRVGTWHVSQGGGCACVSGGLRTSQGG